ncbi:MAG: alpha-ketoacid dehydrogenase subunit beta, partial [Dehalococcoidia bacterium]
AQASTPYDIKGLLKTAIRANQPVIFLEHKLLYRTKGDVPEEEYLIPFGEADIKRPGRDVTVIATSRMVHFALQAAEQLAEEGIDVEVLDPRTLVPLDLEAILNSVKRTKRAVVVHEAFKRGGYGAEIAATIMEEAFDYLDAPVVRVAGRNLPIPYAADLERETVPSPQSIAEAVRSLF